LKTPATGNSGKGESIMQSILDSSKPKDKIMRSVRDGLGQILQKPLIYLWLKTIRYRFPFHAFLLLSSIQFLHH